MEIINEETPAERMYKKHLRNVSKYQKNNKDKIGKKQKEHLERIKEEPERYKALQQRRHEYYLKTKAAAIATACIAAVVAPEATAVAGAVGTALMGATVLIDANRPQEEELTEYQKDRLAKRNARKSFIKN